MCRLPCLGVLLRPKKPRQVAKKSRGSRPVFLLSHLSSKVRNENSVLGSLQKQFLQSEPEAGENGATVEIISDLENPYVGRGVVQVNLAGTRINDPDLTYARAKVILDLLGHLFRSVGQAEDLDREIGNDFPGLGSRNAASKRPSLD